jgi:hypothetical protein
MARNASTSVNVRDLVLSARESDSGRLHAKHGYTVFLLALSMGSPLTVSSLDEESQQSIGASIGPCTLGLGLVLNKD